MARWANLASRSNPPVWVRLCARLNMTSTQPAPRLSASPESSIGFRPIVQIDRSPFWGIFRMARMK